MGLLESIVRGLVQLGVGLPSQLGQLEGRDSLVHQKMRLLFLEHQSVERVVLGLALVQTHVLTEVP